MNTIGWVVPGGPVPRTGGTLYNRRMVRSLEQIGISVLSIPLQASWPLPSDTELEDLAGLLADLPTGLPLVVDGLLWTGICALGPSLAHTHPCTVLVHSPLFRETGLDPARVRTLHRLEGSALGLATRCVATGGPTLRDLQTEFGLDACAIPPGVRPTATASAETPLALLCVATLTPRKGHDRLLHGLAEARDLPWTLTCAGSTTTDPAWFRHICTLTRELGLSERVTFAGELEQIELDGRFQEAGLVVHTAHYEAWGMALTEALARGIPLLSTPAGALEGAAATAAHLLPAQPTPQDVANALRSIVEGEHATLRQAARDLRLPTWEDRARQLWTVMRP